MDQREYFEAYEESLRVALDGHQATVQTNMPGIIVSFNAGPQTAVVQPAIQSIQSDPTSKLTPIDIPPMNDVPVEFPTGGGYTVTFPVKPGDECMLSFSSRAIDGWWDTGKVAPPPHPRMHDLSDAVCRVGVRSRGRAVSGISASSAQFRNDAGDAYVEIADSKIVTIKSPVQIIMDTPLTTFTGLVETTATNGGSGNVTIKGTLNTTQDITSQTEVRAASNTLTQHTHPETGSETKGPIG